MKRKNVVTIVAVIVVAVAAFFLVNSNNHSSSSENKQSTKSSSTSVAKSEKSSSVSSSSSDSDDNDDSSHIQIMKGATKTVSGLKIKLNDVKATNLSSPGGKLAQYDMTVTNTKSKEMYVLADAQRGGVFSTGIKGNNSSGGLYTVLKGPNWWISDTEYINKNSDTSALNSIDWISSKLTQDQNLFFGSDTNHLENYLIWKLEPGQTISGSALGDGEQSAANFSDAMLVVNSDNINMSKATVNQIVQYQKDRQQHNGQ